MNRLQIVANPQITDANPTYDRWQQTHGFSKKKKKKNQYMCPIHQVKQKLKLET